MILAVDASRSRSGGALVHLLNLIPRLAEKSEILKIHFWIHVDEKKIIEILESTPKIEIHKVSLNSVISLLIWQKFILPLEIKSSGCNCIFNTDAGTVLTLKPSVTLSQDMQAFEPGIKEMIPLFTRRRLRQEILRLVQINSLRNSNKRIFLTDYARDVINKAIGNSTNSVVIPHAVDPEMQVGHHPFNEALKNNWLYISYFAEFKHQIEVIQALDKLSEERGIEIQLTLVGGGNNEYFQKFRKELAGVSNNLKVNLIGFVDKSVLREFVRQAEVFIFASSCENMPITLLEGMINAKLILCSNRGPMPEVLQDGGLYFDPRDKDSLFQTALNMLNLNQVEREEYGRKAKERALQFNWDDIAEKYYLVFKETCSGN